MKKIFRRWCTALLTVSMLATLLSFGVSAQFSDISDSETSIAVAALSGMGIVNGISDTEFSPDTTVTRAQACKMLVGAMGLSGKVDTYAKKTLFSDVKGGYWYTGYVNLACNQGVINGYGNGTFGPDDTVTYGQLATMLLRMLGYKNDDIGSVWPRDYTALCEELGISDDLGLGDNDLLTRGNTAIMIYRTLKATQAGSGRPYYNAMSNVSSTASAILLDVNATNSGTTGLVLAYSLEGEGGTAYYGQVTQQSQALTGCSGTLLFNGAGRVVGFIPDSNRSQSVQLGSATASSLTLSTGVSLRIPNTAKVVINGELYQYSTLGYIQLRNSSGKNACIYYDDSGAVSYIYVGGGSSGSSEITVAESASSALSLAQALGVENTAYSVTKNGAAAGSSDIAKYDVAYYDSATATIRVSDYKVSGYIAAASPSMAAAETITVAGHAFTMTENAREELKSYKLGSKVTLLLTDDCKVASVRDTSVAADMMGILSTNGRSVTLIGSGITLTASEVSYNESAPGSIVKVEFNSASVMTCTVPYGNSAKKLDIAAKKLGTVELASSCAIYEWAGSGYLYGLDGTQGVASSDLSAISGLETLSASNISYSHTNTAGKIDILILKNVTGNCYSYGKLNTYTGTSGVTIGAGQSAETKRAVSVANSGGSGTKYVSDEGTSGTYCGIALRAGESGTTETSTIKTLTRLSMTPSGFYTKSGSWYYETGNETYTLSDDIEIYIPAADSWLSGETGLAAVLTGDYTLQGYYDAFSANGGIIRILVAS